MSARIKDPLAPEITGAHCDCGTLKVDGVCPQCHPLRKHSLTLEQRNRKARELERKSNRKWIPGGGPVW